MLKTLIIQQGNSDDDKLMLMIMKGKHYAFPWVGRGFLKSLFYRLLAQTTLRNILGTKNLHEILSDRDSISGSMQVVIVIHHCNYQHRYYYPS